MAKNQQDSDGLPFVQVDRAVRGRASLLAARLKSSNQHALGSLVEWWDLCGDPRALEQIVAATPEGQEPQVVLTRNEVELRFSLASTQHVEAEVLALLGLLEPLDGDRFRVRGMSRYFGAISARVRARSVASAGGKASADARKKSHGSSRPGSGVGSGVGSQSVQESVRVGSQESNRLRTLEDRGQRTEVRDDPDPGDPEQFELVDADPRSDPKARKRSAWEVLWEETLKVDRLRQIAISEGFQSGLDEGFDREAHELSISPAQLNTLLAKIGADLEREFANGAEWSFEQKALAIELAWGGYLEGSFGASVEPPYALNAFASPKTSLPSYRRAKAGA